MKISAILIQHGIFLSLNCLQKKFEEIFSKICNIETSQWIGRVDVLLLAPLEERLRYEAKLNKKTLIESPQREDEASAAAGTIDVDILLEDSDPEYIGPFSLASPTNSSLVIEYDT